MIVPSIDIMAGRAVQLRRGKDFVLDGGDPIARLEEFSIAGDVAVVDLDAALGQGRSERRHLGSRNAVHHDVGDRLLVGRVTQFAAQVRAGAAFAVGPARLPRPLCGLAA